MRGHAIVFVGNCTRSYRLGNIGFSICEQRSYYARCGVQLQGCCFDRLVRFLREVRLLSSLGFKMTPLVQGNADVAHKFYRHGVVLKQVANFYNTIEKQIVRSQKPLLLDYAHQFEKLATNPTAKAGVNHYTRILAKQLQPFNVNVNAICPGATRTGRFMYNAKAGAQGDWITKLKTGGTLDRVAMVDEVARVVDFFAGNGGQFVTGQILRVDGGASLGCVA